MNYKEETKRIVDEIKRLEEEKYSNIDLKLNVEIPTVIEYYTDSFKKGHFDLKRNDSLSLKCSLIQGLTSSGWAYGSSDSICVMSRDYCSILHILTNPMNEMFKKLPYQKMMVAYVTFHEIRHVIQHKYADDLSAYEHFCCDCLSDYEGLKGIVNNRFHDSLYKEIDADYYAAVQSQQYFKNNKDIQDYFAKKAGKLAIQKYTYDFDSKLENYQKENEESKCKLGGCFYYEEFIWNQDGTFKKPKDIFSDVRFHEMLEEYPDTREFYYRVISSEAYLSRLNLNELTIDEKEAIKNAIYEGNKFLRSDKIAIIRNFQKGWIDRDEYEKAMSTLNSRINKKENYRKQLGVSEVSEEQPFNINVKTIDEFLEDLLTPEPPKKVKLITKARESLKKIIDKVVRIPSGVVVLGAAYLSEIMAILTNSSALFSGVVAALGTGIVAAEIHKHSSGKR